MAITTQDQLVAAMAAAAGNGNRPPYVKTALAGTFAAGQFVSLWTAPGQPGAGSAPAATPGAVPTSATAGAISFTNPAAGNSYLSRLSCVASVPGMLVFYDRLVAVGSVILTSTSAQTVSSAALTRPSATGTNAELWIEITTTVTGSPGNITASYTNTVPTSGQTTTAVAVTTAMIAGVTFQLPLAAGDSGVNAVASTTMSAAATAGACNVVIRRRIAELPMPVAYTLYQPQDPFATGIPQIYNSACIEAIFLIGSGTAAPAIPSGSLILAQG